MARTIYEIRFFEEKVYDLLGQNIIKGASHLYAGQEAVATGAVAAIERGDVIGSTHRGHGHCGAIGNKYCNCEEDRQNHWNAMMAELMGKETGYCKGRGGSMHIAEVEKQNNLGSTGIVGGNQPPAVGAALAEKFKKSGKVVISFFGDGSCNTGTFHESMNMAATLKVPLVAVIENNLYGMSVPFSGSPVEGTRCASSIEDIAERAAAYDVPAMIVDGMDVLAVYLAVKKAVERARQESLMTMIECKTYRWYGHSRSDPREYRTKAEEKAWHDRDPIIVLRGKLASEGFCTRSRTGPDQGQGLHDYRDGDAVRHEQSLAESRRCGQGRVRRGDLSGPGGREREDHGRPKSGRPRRPSRSWSRPRRPRPRKRRPNRPRPRSSPNSAWTC